MALIVAWFGSVPVAHIIHPMGTSYVSKATILKILKVDHHSGLRSRNQKTRWVSDGGSENFGEVDQLLEDSSSLRRVLAQIDIISSNS